MENHLSSRDPIKTTSRNPKCSFGLRDAETYYLFVDSLPRLVPVGIGGALLTLSIFALRKVWNVSAPNGLNKEVSVFKEII